MNIRAWGRVSRQRVQQVQRCPRGGGGDGRGGAEGHLGRSPRRARVACGRSFVKCEAHKQPLEGFTQGSDASRTPSAFLQGGLGASWSTRHEGATAEARRATRSRGVESTDPRSLLPSAVLRGKCPKIRGLGFLLCETDVTTGTPTPWSVKRLQILSPQKQPGYTPARV